MFWYLFIIALLVLLIAPFFAYREVRDLNERLQAQLQELEQRYEAFVQHRIQQARLQTIGPGIDAESLQEAAMRFLQADIGKFLTVLQRRPYAGLSFQSSSTLLQRFRQQLEQACELLQRQRNADLPLPHLKEALAEDIESDLLQRLLKSDA